MLTIRLETPEGGDSVHRVNEQAFGQREGQILLRSCVTGTH